MNREAVERLEIKIVPLTKFLAGFLPFKNLKLGFFDGSRLVTRPEAAPHEMVHAYLCHRLGKTKSPLEKNVDEIAAMLAYALSQPFKEVRFEDYVAARRAFLELLRRDYWTEIDNAVLELKDFLAQKIPERFRRADKVRRFGLFAAGFTVFSTANPIYAVAILESISKVADYLETREMQKILRSLSLFSGQKESEEFLKILQSARDYKDLQHRLLVWVKNLPARPIGFPENVEEGLRFVFRKEEKETP